MTTEGPREDGKKLKLKKVKKNHLREIAVIAVEALPEGLRKVKLGLLNFRLCQLESRDLGTKLLRP